MTLIDLCIDLFRFIHGFFEYGHAANRFVLQFLIQSLQLLPDWVRLLLRMDRLVHAEAACLCVSAHTVDFSLQVLELSLFVAHVVLHLGHVYLGLLAVGLELRLVVHALLGLRKEVFAVGLSKIALNTLDLVSKNVVLLFEL